MYRTHLCADGLVARPLTALFPGQLFVHLQRDRVVRELVRVNKPDGNLVVCISRQAVTGEEARLGIECLGIAFHQSLNLRLSRLVARGCIGSRQG